MLRERAFFFGAFVGDGRALEPRLDRDGRSISMGSGPRPRANLAWAAPSVAAGGALRRRGTGGGGLGRPPLGNDAARRPAMCYLAAVLAAQPKLAAAPNCARVCLGIPSKQRPITGPAQSPALLGAAPSGVHEEEERKLGG